MKLLVVLSVFALCAHQVTPLFFGHFHGKKSAGQAAPAPPPPPPPPPPPVSNHPAPSNGGNGGHGGLSGLGGLGGLGNILAIPLSIKKNLLISHQKKINKHFDKIINALSSFGGSSSSSSASASASSGSTSVNGNFNDGQEYENFGGSDATFSSQSTGGAQSFGFDSNNFDSTAAHSTGAGGSFNANYNGGSSGSFAASSGGSFSTSNSGSHNVGNSGSHAESFDVRGGGHSNVQTYHPQPAPNVAYKDVPITVHLYQVEIPQAAPAPTYSNVQSNSLVGERLQYDQLPVAPQRTYGPPLTPSFAPVEPIAPAQTFAPVEPIAPPSNVYGPPGHNPPPPVNDYLPPNCNNPTHRH